MKSPTAALASLLLVPVFASVVDFTGTWTGSLTVMRTDGNSQTVRAWADFKQEGSLITGFMGDGPEDRHAISEATLKENKLSLRITDGGRTLIF